MYGSNFTEPGAAGLKAGINEVFLTFVGLNNYSNDNGSGPVLDFVFTSKANPSREYRHRMFPVDAATLPTRYQDYVTNATKKGGNVLSLADFSARQYDNFSGEVKQIITQYMSQSKFEEYRTRWLAKLKEKNLPQTFEAFVKFVSTALATEVPNFKQIPGYLLLGYRPNSKYLSTPRFAQDTGIYFATDPDIKLELWDNSKMVFTKPDSGNQGGFVINDDDMPVTSNAAPTSATKAEEPVKEAAVSADDDDLPF